jgi:hypothetical protein
MMNLGGLWVVGWGAAALLAGGVWWSAATGSDPCENILVSFGEFSESGQNVKQVVIG